MTNYPLCGEYQGEHMPTLKVTWHTKKDQIVCPICRSLEGYTWTFDTRKNDKVRDVLKHPVHGAVWGPQGSLIKEEHGKCRCEIKTEIDWSDAVAKLAKIQDTLAATRGRGHNQQLRREIAGDMEMLEKKIREVDEK